MTSIAHVALKVADIDRSLAFYTGTMGFAEMMRLHHADGSLFLIYLRITDDQFLELFPDGQGDQGPGPGANSVHHYCLSVDDLQATVAEIMARGGKFSQWQADGSGLRQIDGTGIAEGVDGNLQAWLQDPDGHRIELMQMAPDSLQAQAIRRLRGA